MANLRTLASYYRELQRQVELNDGELTDEMLEELTQYEDDIDTKIDAMAVLMTDATMWADRHKADAAESKHMEMVKRNQVRRMKDWIQKNLDDAGIEKAGRKYPHVVRDNAVPTFTWERIGEPIPEEFQAVKPATIILDVWKCREAWQQGDKSSVLLPDGIVAARGRHIQAAYRKTNDKGSEDE